MTRLVALLVVLLSVALPLRATDPIYINNSPVTVNDLPPQIDATRFVNRSVFEVFTGFGTGFIFIGGGGGGVVFFGGTLQPYETMHTAFFTNAPGASMFGNPGFRFTFFTNNTRLGMEWWENRGVIEGDPLLLINASNIVHRGHLQVSDLGLLRLEGGTIDVRRSTMLAGLPPGFPSFGGGTVGTNHQNAVGVSDLYWGAGLNNSMTSGAPSVQIDGPPFSNYPDPSLSPVHEVAQRIGNGFFTNTTLVGGAGYAPFVFTNQAGPMDFQVQIVFVQTNNIDPNLVTDVRFAPGGPNGGADVIVSFESLDPDIFTGGLSTNGIYFVDHSAFTTNIGLTWNGPNFLGLNRTLRPDTYELFRSPPFELAFAVPANSDFTNITLYTTNMVTNVVDMGYAAYGASWVGAALTNNIIIGGPFGTNLPPPGRIEIVGDIVDLDRARFKAETTLNIKAENLTSNRVARVDAPFLHFDLASGVPPLVITNLAPPAVRRFSGTLAAWSGVWENTIADTNGDINIEFHVLIVDAFIQTVVGVNTLDLALAAEHVEIADVVTATRSVKIDAPNLTVSGSFTLPADPSYHWAHSNVMNLVNFTNTGTVTISGGAFFGVDPSGFDLVDVPPLDNYVIAGSGSIFAAGHEVESDNIEIAGLVDAYAGTISLEGSTITLAGGTLSASSDIEIRANSFAATNSTILAGAFGAPGSLIMDVSGSLIDAGPSEPNNWVTSGGIQMLTLPGTSDLLGTFVTVRTQPFGEARIAWPANDGGGFGNNLGLGGLILDGGQDSYFIFESSTGGAAAIYVSDLQLLGAATDPANIEIAENFTVYFATSNVDPTAIHPRFVQVAAPAPRPASAPAPVPPIRPANPALAQSVTLDSDGDGTVNIFDTTPFFTADDLDLRVSVVDGKSLLSWKAPPKSVSTVEYKNSLNDVAWHPLPPIQNSGTVARALTVTDTPSSGVAQQRFYRVRVR